jgi:hypothetical protein
MMQYTIQPLAWLVVLAVLMSFIEHQVHRRGTATVNRGHVAPVIAW